MLIIDAGALYEVVVGTHRGLAIEQRLELDADSAAPHVIDVEVFGVIRRNFRLELLDRTAALLALQRLSGWPVQRYGHRAFLQRAWQLRDNLRGWDAMYVGLAEALRGTLLTTDARLARAAGLYCAVELAPS